MAAADLARLLVLGALWGASFLFIKLGVDEVPALGVVEGRLALGAITVLVYGLVVRQRGMLGALRRPMVTVVAVISAAIPYLCFAAGETRVASGVAAIVNASAPVFAALLAHVWPRGRGGEALTVRRGLGVFIGLGGVVALVGIDGLRGNVDLLGLGIVLVAPVCYAVGALLVRGVFAADPPLVPAASTNVAAALLVLPLALTLGRPDHGVHASAGFGIVALGVGGTGVAYILYFRLLENVGATRALSVTFLLPAFALFYGAVFLSEPLRPGSVFALVLILAGVAVTNDVVTLPRRRAAPLTGKAVGAADPCGRRPGE